MDWAKIVAKVEHGRTLEEGRLSDFLQTISTSDDAEVVERLLRLTSPADDLLATSAGQADPWSPPLQEGARIGPWKIDGHIGRGGMGDVYRAHRADGLYDQTVALKVIQGISPQRGNRFEDERRRLALMEHPGIARIIDGGTTEDGRPYMAMEYVDGRPISQYVSSEHPDRTQRLRLFQDVCDAVAHAHAKLTLHRDIKADNVLISKTGSPRLIDFGISTDLQDDSGVRGALTLATAAPEQLKGEPVSVQTDIFALGVLLHEILVGALPERLPDGGMRADADALANADLTAIIQKALQSKPADRYSTVASLSDDISAYLEKRPVAARTSGTWYAGLKFLQRHPLSSTLAAICLVAIAAGLAFSLKFASEASAEASRANEALAQSEESLRRAQFYLKRADLFYETQSAYADALQSLFAGEADVERQTDTLKDRWRQAHDLRESDPRNAAFLSYAIGRNFLFRNDYVSAIEVFEPWLEEGYGSTDLLEYGRQLLAVAYMSSGRKEEALPLLRQVEASYASSFDAGTADHISAAAQVAIVSEKEADIRAAEALLQTGLASEPVDPLRMYYLRQTSKMRQLRGDMDAAYEATRDVVNIIDANPLMEVAGSDTALISLALFELWHTRDVERAGDLAERVIRTAAERKGASRELGEANAIKAEVALRSGQYEQALQEMDAALPLVERYSGPQSDTVVEMKLRRAIILAHLGDEGARRALSSVAADPEKLSSSPRVAELFKLAKIEVVLQLDGKKAAQAAYDTLEPDVQIIRQSPELTARLQILAQAGIE
ncbi:serine/threonine-protein kinase [Henriciella sp. AS95]|uniref:serine/threonine-protein kinase n=1 Tax=Henriciella sp. AS95 TaxID=3135782 RepID=UPI003181EF46